MFLYFFEGYNKMNINSDDLILRALYMYCLENNKEINFEKLSVIRYEGEKPYFEGTDLFFNISHSGTMWVCAIAEKEVGIDLQEVSDRDFEKLSSRFFTENEQQHVNLWGREGFYNIWTRKEAYCKLYGQSVLSVLKEIDTVDGDFYKEKVNNAYFYEIEISQDIKCVTACEEGGKEICLRMIN